MDLLKCNDSKSFDNQQTKVQNVIRATSSTTKKQHTEDTTEQSVITINNSLDSLTDDFELMESLIDENFRTTDSSLNNEKGVTLDEALDIDPYLINENDNLSLPENFGMDEDSPVSSVPNHSVSDNKTKTTIQRKAKVERHVFSGNVSKKSSIKAVRKTSTAPNSANKTNIPSREKSRVTVDHKITKTKLTKKSIFSESTEKIVQLEKRDVSSKKKQLKTNLPSQNKRNTKNSTIEDLEKSKGDWFNIKSEVGFF